MNEKRALEIVGAMLTDMTINDLSIPAAHLLILQSALVFASQSVKSPHHAEMHRDLATRMQDALKTLYPYDFTRPMTQKDLNAAAKTEAPLRMAMTGRDLYLSVCSLQLMSRYPEAQPIMWTLVALGGRFQNLIVRSHPNAKTLLNMGWDSRNDR